MHSPAAHVVEIGLYWGGTLLAVHRLRDDGVLTLGDAEGASFRISEPSLPGRLLPFARRAGDRLHLYLFEGMKVGSVVEDQGPDTLTLLSGEEAEVTVGALVLRVRWTEGTRRLPVALLATLDLLFSKFLSASLVTQAAVVAALLLTPELSLDEDLDLWKSATAWVSAPTPKQEKKPPVVEVRSKPIALPEKAAPLFGQHLARRTARTAVRVTEREQATDAAQRALAALGLDGSRGGRGPGLLDAADSSIRQLRGAGVGPGDGPGLGTRSSGPGGGGGALTIGPLGSPGGGGGRDGVELCGGGGCKGKSRVVLSVERTVVKGGLSKDEIQRVVSRHLSQIRHCYERQLTKDPNLAGKLFLFWNIAASGVVATTTVSEDTLGDPTLRQCVLRIVNRMTFPKPRGGGTVDVRYPFVFAPG